MMDIVPNLWSASTSGVNFSSSVQVKEPLMQSATSSLQNDITRMNRTSGTPITTTSQVEDLIPSYMGAYISVINCCIFITGIIANVVVVAAVLRYRHMRSVINFYHVNLSLADLCVLLVCQPIAITEFFNKEVWQLGPIVCKMVPVIEHAVIHTSILTIVVINLERYKAICRPLQVMKQSPSKIKAGLVIPGIWLLSIVMSLPFIGMTEVIEVTFLDGTDGPACVATVDQLWEQIFIGANFLLLFILPCLFMTFMLIHMVRMLRQSKTFRGLQSNHNSSRKDSHASVLSENRWDSAVSLLRQYHGLDMDGIPNTIKEENESSSLNNIFDGANNCNKDADGTPNRFNIQSKDVEVNILDDGMSNAIPLSPTSLQSVTEEQPGNDTSSQDDFAEDGCPTRYRIQDPHSITEEEEEENHHTKLIDTPSAEDGDVGPRYDSRKQGSYKPYDSPDSTSSRDMLLPADSSPEEFKQIESPMGKNRAARMIRRKSSFMTRKTSVEYFELSKAALYARRNSRLDSKSTENSDNICQSIPTVRRNSHADAKLYDCQDGSRNGQFIGRGSVTMETPFINIPHDSAKERHNRVNCAKSPGMSSKKRRCSSISLSEFGSTRNLTDAVSCKRIEKDCQRLGQRDTRRQSCLSKSSTRGSLFAYTRPSIQHGFQIKVIIAIFIYFIISYLPIRLFIVLQIFGPPDLVTSLSLDQYFNVLWCLRILMYLHSAINPMIFSVMSSKFSNAIKSMFLLQKSKPGNFVSSLPLTQLSMDITTAFDTRQRFHSYPLVGSQTPTQNRGRSRLSV